MSASLSACVYPSLCLRILLCLYNIYIILPIYIIYIYIIESFCFAVGCGCCAVLFSHSANWRELSKEIMFPRLNHIYRCNINSKPFQARSYYCTLLPTFLAFPGCLRLLSLPITAIGVGSRCLLYAATADIATALLLAIIGSFSFYNTLTLAVYRLCSPPHTHSKHDRDVIGSAALESMLLWHYVILAILIVGLALQISTLLHEVASSSRKSNSKQSWSTASLFMGICLCKHDAWAFLLRCPVVLGQKVQTVYIIT